MRRGSIVANPVLVGAVTTLVVIVAVFLAYNANNGLPFVPTRELNVRLPNGAELVKGNEVREGGYRIGVVSEMKPVMLGDGSVGAQLKLKLDKKAGSIPVDSSAIIRPRSALGLKYVELTKGSSSTTIPDGGTLPVSQTSQEVELDQVYNIFDQKTRSASQVNLKEFGNAFVGRGSDLNLTIQELPKAFRLLTSVMRNLADPRTQLSNFFRQLDITAGIVAPVSAINAHLFTTMANTFAAIVRNPRALQDTIAKGPSTEAVGTTSFRIQIPFLRDTAAFSKDLTRATAQLRPTLPVLNSALRIGIPVTRRSVALYPELQDALNALLDLAQTPTTNAALRGLTATVATLQPTLRYLGPFVTVCNTWNTFWGWLSEHVSVPVPQGTAEHAAILAGDNQNNGFGNMGAAVPANGEGVVPNSGPPQYFHGDPYGHAVDANGNANCIFGQRGYIRKAFHFGDQFWKNPNGTPRFQIVEDTPLTNTLGYRVGPTYKTYVNGHGQGLNTDHVPPGETFTSEAGGISPKIPALMP
ncbi:MAG TPA: MlaD family protein [Solirubrobacteraceae bacterium]|jgi:virulence factor Mce-like protein|nr:MlaD family protein [Solirubrobacteraceae bacterium]